MATSLFDKLNVLTADEVAQSHGLSRATVFNRRRAGSLSNKGWSRTELSLKRPHARHSFLSLLDAVLQITVRLHGRDHVADFIRNTNFEVAATICGQCDQTERWKKNPNKFRQEVGAIRKFVALGLAQTPGSNP